MSASKRGGRLITNARLRADIEKAWGPIVFDTKSGAFIIGIRTRYLDIPIASGTSRRNALFEAAKVDPPPVPYDYPPYPSKWKSRSMGTRHVRDYTLHGDIIFFQGRLPRESWRYLDDPKNRCSLEEWLQYQATAKRVDS